MVVIAYAFAFTLGFYLIIELIKEIWWILLIGFGVLFIISIIIGIVSKNSIYIGYSDWWDSSDYSDYKSTSNSNVSSSNSSSSSNYSTSTNANGLFYKGSSTIGSVTGTYRDGRIFDGYNSGLNMSSIKASYSNGFVYNGSYAGMGGTVIGRYENGRIYKGNSTFSSDLVATYGNGNIYPSSSSYSIIGKYTGDDEGGAAAAIYYLFYK